MAIRNETQRGSWWPEFISLEEIPGWQEIKSVQRVLKGWSGDEKYQLIFEGGQSYLLRISPAEEFGRKKTEFEIMTKLYELGMPIPQPISLGLCENTQQVLMVLAWREGEDAEGVLPTLSLQEQYKLGVWSGQILKDIHSLPTSNTLEDWHLRFNRKLDRNIKRYLDCKVSFPKDDKMLSYLKDNRHRLNHRPQCFQHGDYHTGNMVISENGNLSIIDFNRWDAGDPWEEFNRIVWSAKVSPEFATGQLHGYFGGVPPLDFFYLLAFYMASNTLSAIPWALSFSENEIRVMISQSQDILNWFEDMKNPVPSWYFDPPLYTGVK